VAGQPVRAAAHERGIDDWGETRQVSFVDYDNDGKVDLLVAFREKANRLYHNEGGRFREVSEQVGITGPQSTVGAIWFDYNEDGRLDLFLANQNGALNRVYRNDGDHFTNVAAALGIDGGVARPNWAAWASPRPISTATAALIYSTRTTARVGCCATTGSANSPTSPRPWA